MYNQSWQVGEGDSLIGCETKAICDGRQSEALSISIP